MRELDERKKGRREEGKKGMDCLPVQLMPLLIHNNLDCSVVVVAVNVCARVFKAKLTFVHE